MTYLYYKDKLIAKPEIEKPEHDEHAETDFEWQIYKREWQAYIEACDKLYNEGIEVSEQLKAVFEAKGIEEVPESDIVIVTVNWHPMYPEMPITKIAYPIDALNSAANFSAQNFPSSGQEATGDWKLKFGIEIVSAMKASAYGVSLEEGREMALEETHIPQVKAMLEKQASFVAGVALDFIKTSEQQEAATEKYDWEFDENLGEFAIYYLQDGAKIHISRSGTAKNAMLITNVLNDSHSKQPAATPTEKEEESEESRWMNAKPKTNWNETSCCLKKKNGGTECKHLCDGCFEFWRIYGSRQPTPNKEGGG